jgi:hypothetical protein
MGLTAPRASNSNRVLRAAAVGSAILLVGLPVGTLLFIVSVFFLYSSERSLLGLVLLLAGFGFAVIGYCAGFVVSAYLSGGWRWVPVGVAAAAMPIVVAAVRPDLGDAVWPILLIFIVACALAVRPIDRRAALVRLFPVGGLSALVLLQSAESMLLAPGVLLVSMVCMAVSDLLVERIHRPRIDGWAQPPPL